MSEKDGTASAGDIARAKLMHGFLVGATGIRRSADGRSDLLASFLALSLVDPDLREVLGRMPPPKVLAMSWTSVDDRLARWRAGRGAASLSVCKVVAPILAGAGVPNTSSLMMLV